MVKTQRQLQKEQTRERILEAATGQFAVKGLTRVRTAEIAEAAQVSHGSLFVHFTTHNELIVAVLARFGSEVSGRLHQLATGKSSLAEVLAAHLTGLQEHEELYTWVIMENKLLPEAAWTSFMSIQSTISHHIGQAAEREMAEGKIKSMQVHLLFNGWVGLVHHYLLNRELFAPGQSVLAARGQELLTHYTGMLAAGK